MDVASRQVVSWFLGGVKYTGWGKFVISTEIAVYLGNGTR